MKHRLLLYIEQRNPNTDKVQCSCGKEFSSYTELGVHLIMEDKKDE